MVLNTNNVAMSMDANSPVRPELLPPSDPRAVQDGADDEVSALGHGDAYSITLSPEASAAIAEGVGVAAQQVTPPPPTPTLPPVIVTAISSKAWALEQYLRSQQPPGVPDYGAIVMQVNRYYSEQNATAYQGVAWANQHVTVDPNLNVNDPATKEQIQQVKDQLAAMAYEGLSNPGKMVNGPDTHDVTAGSLMNTLQNVTINMRAGFAPGNAAAGGTTTYNPNGTTTINLYPNAWSSFFAGTNTPTWAQATTVTFHEIGHALNRAEYEARSAASGIPPAAWTESRANAMGHGAAELAGTTIGQGYFSGATGHPEAPR